MKKLIPILLLVTFFASCEKEDPVKEVTFTLNVSGFQITSTEFGSLKSGQNEIFDNFIHKFSAGNINFTNSDGVRYKFHTLTYPINEFEITLPSGDYTITGSGGNTNPLGLETMAFEIPSQNVSITESTTQINITLKPTCALFLVADQSGLVNQAEIRQQAHNPPKNYFYEDGNLLYSYFLPSDDYIMEIQKIDESVLQIWTKDLSVGYIYEILVSETGKTQTLEIDEGFTQSETIIW